MARILPRIRHVLLAFALPLSVASADAVRAGGGAAGVEGLSVPMQHLLDYAKGQRSTGFLVIQDGRIIVERNWSAPADAPGFENFTYGRTAGGALLEDVASQQKSFVSVLLAIAVDRGVIDFGKPVSVYIGAGWSKAVSEQERHIRVIDLLTMSSGLSESFDYTAPPGQVFLYNTPVYAVIKRILSAATGQPLEASTRAWLTDPLGMKDTAWRQRPSAFASVGNAMGLITSPRDTALFGQMILKGGVAANGTRIVSEAGVKAMFQPSTTNPAYGRLWWLNGSDYTIRAAGRKPGPLVSTAPSDMVAALGALDRRLYIVPSRKLIVVRTGAAAIDRDFDERLWGYIASALMP